MTFVGNATSLWAKATVVDVDGERAIDFEGDSLRQIADLAERLRWGAETYGTTMRACLTGEFSAGRADADGRINGVKAIVRANDLGK